jgi:iron complex outermembrane receptor protein
LSFQLLSALLAAAARAEEPPPEPLPPEPPIIDVPEVSISATRSERSILDVPGNVTVIDAATIERSGAVTLPDLLRREAGLYVTNTTGTPEGTNVEARGFNNGGGNGCSTLVLVDGRRINEPDTGCPDWSFVALQEIERVEIVRGPASVAYGDNAAAGVIHIFTFHPREDGVRTAAHLQTGSWGTHGYAARATARAEGAFATAYLEHDDTDGYRDFAGFRGNGARLGFGADLGETGELRVDGGYGSNHRERPGTLTRDEVHEDRRQAAPDNLGDFDQARARFLQASLDLRPYENVRVQVLPYGRRRTDDGALSGDDGFGGVFDFFTNTETTSQGVDGHTEVDFDAFGQRHTFQVGGEGRREDSDLKSQFESDAFGDSTTDVHLRRDTWGLFVQQEVGLRDDLRLLLGVRRDQIDYHGSGTQDFGGGPMGVDVDETPSVWSPRASLTWRASEPLALYAGYARGFRSPNVQEEVALFSPIGPPDIQKTESYEVGGKYRSERVRGNLAFYWMNVHDEILFDPSTFTNTNLDRVQHRGIEVSGGVRPVPWLDLHASYTFDDVQIEEDDLGQIPITPRNRGSAGVTAELGAGFEAGVEALWVGDRPLANDLDNSSDNLPSYAVYDARLAWRRGLGPLELVIEAIGKNLGNEHYAEFGGEPTFGSEAGFFPSAERSYVLGLRLAYRR